MPLIALASGSPRRREMLKWIGLDYVLCPIEADERRLMDEPPIEYVSRLAETKARGALSFKNQKNNAIDGAAMIVAADTTVADGNAVLGKPVDEEDAYRILKNLRGHAHQVYTALAVYQITEQKWSFDLCGSQVAMRNYSDEEIDAYILSGDPMDKAGAYAIQNSAFHPVTDFLGCFANVMGLPLCHFVRTLNKIGITIPVETSLTCRKHLGYDCSISKDVLAGLDVG